MTGWVRGAGVAAVLAVAAVGCGGGGSALPSPSASSEPLPDPLPDPVPTVAPSPVATPIDVSVVPEVIDEAYVEAVWDALEAVHAEALQIIVDDRPPVGSRVPLEVLERLFAIYSDRLVELYSGGIDERLQSEDDLPYNDPVGPARLDVVEILSADEGCSLVRGLEDIRLVSAVRPLEPSLVYVRLTPREPSRDPAGHNRTAWIISENLLVEFLDVPEEDLVCDAL